MEMEPGGDGESSGKICRRGRILAAITGAVHTALCATGSGAAGVYLLVALSVLPAICGVLVQQVWASDICELSHWSPICRQQSCSDSVIA